MRAGQPLLSGTFGNEGAAFSCRTRRASGRGAWGIDRSRTGAGTDPCSARASVWCADLPIRRSTGRRLRCGTPPPGHGPRSRRLERWKKTPVRAALIPLGWLPVTTSIGSVAASVRFVIARRSLCVRCRRLQKPAHGFGRARGTGGSLLFRYAAHKSAPSHRSGRYGVQAHGLRLRWSPCGVAMNTHFTGADYLQSGGYRRIKIDQMGQM